MALHDVWMRLYILLNARRLGLQLRAMWPIVAEGHTSAASWVLRWSSAVLKTQLLVEAIITVWVGRLLPMCVLLRDLQVSVSLANCFVYMWLDRRCWRAN